MSATSGRSSPRSEPALAALAAALAAFGLAWGLLHVGFWGRGQIVDTPTYERYGDAIRHGAVPYRDFAVEYPPAALPVFVLPALRPGGGYRDAFELVAALCGAAALGAVLLARRALRAPPEPALAFVALAPLALGPVILTRYDLWPAALLAGGLAALLHGRLRIGHGLVATAAAAKLYPLVVLPLALAYAWRRGGPRTAAACLAVAAAAAGVWLLPFLAVAPGGLWHSLTGQAERPLQIESLGAALLLAAHELAGTGVTVESSHGSQNLAGGGADALAAGSTAVQLAVLLALWIGFVRGPATGERLVRHAAAAVCAFVALGKVLSPQFLVWLLPLVPLLTGRRGLGAAALLAAALLLTQGWFPLRYWQLANDLAALPVWLVVARDLALVALLVVLAVPLRRRA